MSPEELGDSAILVDTDVFSFVVWKRGPAALYEPYLADRLWVLSFATVAELRHGARKADWGERRFAELERRIKLCVVLSGSDAVVSRWVDLAMRFKDQIGVNDLWIAACAVSQEPVLPIASHDAAFGRIGAEFNIPIVHHDAA